MYILGQQPAVVPMMPVNPTGMLPGNSAGLVPDSAAGMMAGFPETVMQGSSSTVMQMNMGVTLQHQQQTMMAGLSQPATASPTSQVTIGRLVSTCYS